MEQNQSPVTQDADFQKRRAQKNRLVVSLVFGGVFLIWAVTMLKFNPTAFRNVVGVSAEQAETPQIKQEGSHHAQ